jgi:hypothetical protein
VDSSREIIYVYVNQDLVVPESKRIVVALGCCARNDCMIDGSFDFNLADGSLIFRVISSYHDMTIGEWTVEYLIQLSNAMFEKVNGVIIDYIEDKINQTEFLAQMDV